jgi:hypothetical protein
MPIPTAVSIELSGDKRAVLAGWVLYEDNYVVHAGAQLSICFSYLVGKHAITYSTSEWWCESNKKWHTFCNRGFWHDDS